MTHRRKIIAAFVAFFILCVFAWLLLRPAPEPVYNGKTVSQWLELNALPFAEGSSWTDHITRRYLARDAIRTLGTNAIPVLLKKLNTGNSAFKRLLLAHTSAPSAARIGMSQIYLRYAQYSTTQAAMGYDGFLILGPQAECAVPDLIKIIRDPKNPMAQPGSIEILGAIGPAARPALPDIVIAFINPPIQRHPFTVGIIFKIAFDSTTGKFRPDCVPLLVPALIQNLKNPNVDALVVIRLLSDIGPDAAPAIPAIKPFVNSTDVTVSAAAIIALQKIDPSNFPPK